MNFLFKVVILFCTLNSAIALANNKVGNGGYVVVCKNRTQVLDFYEGAVSEPANLSPNTNLDLAKKQIEKLNSIAPELYLQYKKRLQNILNEFDFKEDVRLIDVKDSNHAFVPIAKDCEVIQTVIRKATIAKDEKRFLVDQATWDRLSAYQQAGLILHEIIYEHFSKLGEDTSIKARKLNAFLFKSEPDKKYFWDFIKELDIAIYP